MKVFHYETLRVKNSEELELACQLTGIPSKGDIIFVNGLAGRFSYWRHQILSLQDNYRCTSWDHRGFYDSSVPPVPSQLDIPYHVQDMKQIMDSLGLRQAMICAWSIGVQIALEFYRQYPESCKALILVNGAFDGDRQRLFHLPFSKRTVTRFSRVLKLLVPVLTPAVKAAPYLPCSLPVMKLLGVFSSTLEPETWHYVLRDLPALNLESFAIMMEFAINHSVYDILPTVAIPTLVIGSGKDHLVTVKQYADINARIPNSEFLMVPLGTHYAPLEFPEVINLRIEKFLRDHEL